jgi:hypothetical protein
MLSAVLKSETAVKMSMDAFNVLKKLKGKV